MVLSHDSSLSGTVVAAYLLNTSISILFQGLAALYEKEDDPKLKAELPEVYTKLLHMYERYSVCTCCMVYESTGCLLFYFHAFYTVWMVKCQKMRSIASQLV